MTTQHDYPPVTLLCDGLALTSDGFVRADVAVANGRILAIGSVEFVGRPDSVLDVEGLLLSPGFIDLQVNGGFGHDFTQDPSKIWDVGAKLPEYGVTTFLPTIISSPETTIAFAQRIMMEGPPPDYVGAVPVGLHVEGPMLSPKQRGTHDQRYLRDPEDVNTKAWSPETGVRMVTLAPELPGALDVIKSLAEQSVTVSLGHSDATYDEAVAGIRAGATVGTHIYNAMSGLHHREPGLVGAILAEPTITVEIIVDGIHSHPAAVRLAWEVKGPDRLVLITDAMAAMGMGHGQFVISTVDVFVDETGPRNIDGVLAGSVLTLDEAVRNLVAFTGCSPADAIGAATANPSKCIGDSGRGVIDVGARADIALLDSDLTVVATLIGGDVVHGDLEERLDTSSNTQGGY